MLLGAVERALHTASMGISPWVFDLEPGEYLITDESDVRDFTEMGSSDTSEIWKRIDEVYGIVSADVRSGRLVDIFMEVAQRSRSRQ